MDDAQREDRTQPVFVARRVRMPSSGVVSWTVVGPDGRVVGVIDGSQRSSTPGGYAAKPARPSAAAPPKCGSLCSPPPPPDTQPRDILREHGELKPAITAPRVP